MKAVSYRPLYFSMIETRCKCGKCTGHSHHQPLEDQLLIRLDLLRTIIGAPIRVNSGWRCPEHNARVEGSANSFHMRGRAADITADNIEALFAAADRLNKIYLYEFAELIKYPAKRFLHVAR